jgi:hypothetical protein
VKTVDSFPGTERDILDVVFDCGVKYGENFRG